MKIELRMTILDEANLRDDCSKQNTFQITGPKPFTKSTIPPDMKLSAHGAIFQASPSGTATKSEDHCQEPHEVAGAPGIPRGLRRQLCQMPPDTPILTPYF